MDIAPLLTQEQGKPFQQACGEVFGSTRAFDAAATLDLSTRHLMRDESVSVSLNRRPLGLVAAITPWNFPLVLASWKIAPALMAGNAVILKPSPYTPLSTLKMGEVLNQVLPPGVLQILSGDDELGRLMTSHPAFAKISFTGSTETGKSIARTTASDLKRLTLELGGNDPAIILEDVDLEKRVQAIFWGAFGNAGQVCAAIKRIYVHESIAPKLTEALVDIAHTVKVGPGMDPESDMGPINNLPQYEKVIHLVDDARREGAHVLTGGTPLSGPGYFFPPTLITNVHESSRVVKEEQFGPVVPILTFSDEEEVIHRVNQSMFGLGSSIWTSDVDRAHRLASGIEAGTTWINGHSNMLVEAPFGGRKWSGIGYENGEWGLHELTSLHCVQEILS